LVSGRDDALLATPTGISARNIDGKTIQSLFNIRPHAYKANDSLDNIKNLNSLINASMLIIDEISMVRMELIDIVNEKLQLIKGNRLPFGGIKLVFVGDLMQLEPVLPKNEIPYLRRYYPELENDAGFYNAHVLKNNNYFYNNFECFKLNHNFRQNQDAAFQKMLDSVRKGKITDCM